MSDNTINTVKLVDLKICIKKFRFKNGKEKKKKFLGLPKYNYYKMEMLF
jgi:hypothetical protein